MAERPVNENGEDCRCSDGGEAGKLCLDLADDAELFVGLVVDKHADCDERMRMGCGVGLCVKRRLPRRRELQRGAVRRGRQRRALGQ